MEFNKCPEIDSDLKDWINVYPSIIEILETDPELYAGGQHKCFEWKASELAKYKEVILEDEKDPKNPNKIEYVFPTEEIIKILDGYAGGSWVSDAHPKLKEKREKLISKKIKEVREYEEKERTYINNIVRDWNKYDTPKAEQGEYYLTNYGVNRRVETLGEDGKPLIVKKEVCRSPFVVCGVSRPFSDGENYYKIRFADVDKNVQEFWGSQSDLLSKQELKKLFLFMGINCPENSLLLESLEYISRSISEFGYLYKRERSTKKCGWNEGRTLFILGDRAISANGVEPILAIGKNGFEELNKVGTPQGWVEGVSPMMKYDVVRFKCYDAMTAILKAPLGVESHCSDHYGNTSVGKTFTAWLALSMVGNAEGIAISAKSSVKGILVKVRDFSDLPILIDEISDAGKKVAEIVYPLTSNKGRNVSSQKGEREGGEEYHTSTMFTSENPARDCLTNSGQQYRVNELNDTLPTLETKEIFRVTRAIRENHGHIIELFLEEVFKLMESNTLLDKFEQCFDKLPPTTSNIEGRSRAIFACIMTAGEILEPIFQRLGIPPKDPTELVNKYFKQCVLEKPVELEYIRALRITLDWVASERASFVQGKSGYHDASAINKSKTCGFEDEEYIDLIQSEFSNKMKVSGFSPTKIKEDWFKVGITESNDPKRPGTYRSSKNGYGSYAGIRIKKSVACDLAGYEFKREVKNESEEEGVKNFDQFEKRSLILETINLLTKARGKADIHIIRQILPFKELDDYLFVMKNKGDIMAISQTEYMPVIRG